ncbi:YihY/virulence factor BrkB family protein [Solirubrobacter ginsenosidimutans]|uniref:YihY/virulence factor BrkB family protein n=1 Tax=Solirubrobacter ginsenosidimutans TaxID=490573 RepID=A0A9X3MMN2_9ACTN|nr:YihY/virulence factor BrkB family protein [Solirubrobacter ginsenosidimutans]MDA0158982.1 YihY/virulence factor BrkB family protein [Solirubrobacter ginsenosidimutans]
MWARALAAVDAWQRAHAAVAFPFAVLKKFGEDRASSLAALMAYYGFLSLFPLLLVFVSVLGFVLEDDPALQQDIVDSAVARIPGIGAQLSDQVEPLTGSTPALVIGLVGALWAGLGVTLALGRAFNEIWDVPRFEQRKALLARAYGLAALAVLGVALVASTLLAGLALGGGIGPSLERLTAVALSLVLNVAVLLAVFGLLTQRPFRIPELLPGVTLAAVGGLILQSVGGVYVNRTVIGASDTYGTFALVIGLLSWFWLASHLLLFAAEVNVVLRRRLWPRSLTGDFAPADREALRRSAEASRHDEREEISVRFEDDASERS